MNIRGDGLLLPLQGNAADTSSKELGAVGCCQRTEGCSPPSRPSNTLPCTVLSLVFLSILIKSQSCLFFFSNSTQWYMKAGPQEELVPGAIILG